jgi:hypothetical protein
MPLTSGIKDELAHLKPRKKCDRLAELSALVRMTGSLVLRRGGYDLTMATASPAVARRILLLLKDQFAIDTELITEPPSPRHKRPNHIINVHTQIRQGHVLRQLRVMDEDDVFTRGVPFEILKKNCCRAAYLRGLFLAGGSLTGERHGYHMEIATANMTLAEDVLTLMEEAGFPVRLNERAKDFAVYLTDAESAGDFLVAVGAHKGRLTLESRRVLRGVRSDVNRRVNAETANLRKSAGAAVSQLRDIKEIDKKIGLNRLPSALRETAEVRLKNPSLGTAELGQSHNPPITKSAVNHRLRRLRDMAASI